MSDMPLLNNGSVYMFIYSGGIKKYSETSANYQTARAISQKTVLFILAAVKTSDLIKSF
jgi:hypothetical protein